MAKFLTAEWKNLIMANYVVDPAILEQYLPNRTVIDDFGGNVYVSLVGFMFANTRVMGVPIPYHINFEEVNLRFYVRHLDREVWKRGVVFIKEIVPRRAISFIANNLYRENYCSLPMRHFLDLSASEMKLGYDWKYKNKWNRLEVVTEIGSIPMSDDSEVHFITEHYWGYSRQSADLTFEYEVQHVPWRIYPVKNFLVDCDFGGLYGNGFSFLQNTAPLSVFVAAGSPVAVLRRSSLRTLPGNL